MILPFSAKDPSEKIVLGIDFTEPLNTGETITAASWSILRSDGYTGDTTLATSGAVDITAQPVVRQLVQGGTAGSTYIHTVTVTTNQGRVLVASSSQAVTLGGA